MKRAKSWFGLLTALLTLNGAFGAEPSTAHVLAGLVDTAVRAGQDAALPPHLSVLLGISAGETSTPVRQLAFKNGDAMKTLNVCAADHRNVVLMSVSDNHRAAAYLMSSKGVLLKAFEYEIGGETHELELAVAGGNFLHERQLWISRAPALAISR
jgi:hypothetical protein